VSLGLNKFRKVLDTTGYVVNLVFVDFGGFRGFRFLVVWISWISIIRPSVNTLGLEKEIGYTGVFAVLVDFVLLCWISWISLFSHVDFVVFVDFDN